MVVGPPPGPGVSPDSTAVKLLDFGAAKRADVLGEDGDRSGNVFMGTMEYAPPEQWAGNAVPASDLYALGGTLFYLLAGRSPFKKERRDPLAYRRSHREDDAPDVREFAPDVPTSVALLIRRMLVKDPAERGTAEELIAKFRQAVPRPTGPAVRPAAVPQRVATGRSPQPAGGSGEHGPQHPLDPILAVFERAFIPEHLRPPPGEALTPRERLAALVRRPPVIVILGIIFALCILLIRWLA
jgi:serine/threonine protein kinase